VLLTGMSGTGKSTVIRELAARGYRAVDTDEGGWSRLVAVGGDELTGPGGGQDWVWREDRIDALLSTQDTLFVSGCAPNQVRFYPRFDHIILLTAPAAVLAERLATRTTNTFGRRPGEIDRTLALQQTIEPLLRRAADLVLDTTAAPDEVVEAVLRYARLPPVAGQQVRKR
jgi:shikimate kinase